MSDRELTTLKKAIKELDGNSMEYFIISFDSNDEDKMSVLCQGNILKMAIALMKEADEMKDKAMKTILSDLLEKVEVKVAKKEASLNVAKH